MMSDTPPRWWESMVTTLRFWVARFAIRFCGLPTPRLPAGAYTGRRIAL